MAGTTGKTTQDSGKALETLVPKATPVAQGLRLPSNRALLRAQGGGAGAPGISLPGYPLLQAKLVAGPSHDAFEREADRVADAVVGGALAPPPTISGVTAPTVQRDDKTDAGKAPPPPTTFPVQEVPKQGAEKDKEDKKKLEDAALKAAGELATRSWDAFSSSPEGQQVLGRIKTDFKPIITFFEDFSAHTVGQATLGLVGAGAMTAGFLGARAARDADQAAGVAAGLPAVARAPTNEKFFALELNWDFISPPSGIKIKTPWLDSPTLGGTDSSRPAAPPPLPDFPKPTLKIPRICSASAPAAETDAAVAQDAVLYNWLLLRREQDKAFVDDLMKRLQPLAPPSGQPGQPKQYVPSAVSPIKPMFKRADGVAQAIAPGVVEMGLRSPGRPLDGRALALLEPRFGRDLGAVRIHNGPDAARSAAALRARAYTLGPDIVFGAGEYRPGTLAGQRLLAHELTHTLQQVGRGHSAPTTDRAGTAAGPTAQAATRTWATGNRALLRGRAATARVPGAGPRIKIGSPGDRTELAAEQLADRALGAPGQAARLPTPAAGALALRRASADQARSQAKSQSGGQGGEPAAPPIVHAVLRSGGRALEPATRDRMQTLLRLGAGPGAASASFDFARVRIHTDAPAAASARAVGARAYTVGQSIVFGAGQYDPGAAGGRRLLAHELAHVAQARAGVGDGATLYRQTSDTAPPPPPAAADGEQQKPDAEAVPAVWTPESLPVYEELVQAWERKLIAETPPDAPLTATQIDDIDKTIQQHFQALKDRDRKIRDLAVAKAQSLMNADWHARPGSEAKQKADSLHAGTDPAQERINALNKAMAAAKATQAAIAVKMRAAQDVLDSKVPGSKENGRKVLSAGNDLLAVLNAAPARGWEDTEVSGGPAEMAWRELTSEKSKKAFETLGISIPWFTTCVTLPTPVAKAAGVDLKQWNPLDVFASNKAAAERFKKLDGRNAWIPAEFKQQPEPGDILIMVSYPIVNKVPQKAPGKATFQHVAVLLEVSTVDADTEKWLTADGGKGSSHKGEDKTGTTERFYKPASQQFVAKPDAVPEAAQGGRFLLGFWSLPRLPQVQGPPQQKP